jgi:hypothetical protein
MIDAEADINYQNLTVAFALLVYGASIKNFIKVGVHKRHL